VTFDSVAQKVREHLDQEHRYEHSVRVANAAEELANRHGVDARKARLAGRLHDLARLYTPERLLAEAEARGFAIDAEHRQRPTLLHARLGAALAHEAFGIDDAEILCAIEKHTRGAAAMSPLDCVVYLADTLEPNRTFPERAGLWELALRDLAGATRETMRVKAEYYAQKLAAQAAAAQTATGVS
jgi:predicted HD superfamily hydrolase involved in NAD metabolism